MPNCFFNLLGVGRNLGHDELSIRLREAVLAVFGDADGLLCRANGRIEVSTPMVQARECDQDVCFVINEIRLSAASERVCQTLLGLIETVR
jgi:hypothetical protein